MKKVKTVTLYTPEGDKFIDFASGIGVNSLGYGNEINVHGEGDLVGVLPFIVIVDVKGLQSVPQGVDYLHGRSIHTPHFRVTDV